jgi:hypothetical protein
MEFRDVAEEKVHLGRDFWDMTPFFSFKKINVYTRMA